MVRKRVDDRIDGGLDI
jgi:hypothetical protein